MAYGAAVKFAFRSLASNNDGTVRNRRSRWPARRAGHGGSTATEQLRHGIILPNAGPRTIRNIAHLNKFPIRHVHWSQAQVIPHGRRNIEPGTLVQVRLGAIISENIFPMIRSERAAVAPLRETNAVALANRDPTIPTDALSVALKGLREP